MDNFDELFPVENISDRKWSKKRDSKSKYKQGKFTDEELQKVKESLTNYALLNNLNEQEFESLITNSQKSQMPKAWLEIAKVLPNRTVQSVYNQVKSKWNPDNYQGHWTQEEEQQLLQLVEQYGRKFSILSKYLNRTALNIRDKLRALGDQNYELRDQIWKIGEVIQFLRIIAKITKINFIKENWEELLIENFGQNWENIIIITSSQKKRFKKITYYNIDQDETQILQILIIIDLKLFNTVDIQGLPWKKIAGIIKTKSQDDLRNFWHQSILKWKMIVKTTIDDEQLINDIMIQEPLTEQEIDFQLVLKNLPISNNEKIQAWNNLKKRVQIRDTQDFDELLEGIRKLVKKTKKELKYDKQEIKKEKSSKFNELLEEYKLLINPE